MNVINEELVETRAEEKLIQDIVIELLQYIKDLEVERESHQNRYERRIARRILKYEKAHG